MLDAAEYAEIRRELAQMLLRLRDARAMPLYDANLSAIRAADPDASILMTEAMHFAHGCRSIPQGWLERAAEGATSTMPDSSGPGPDNATGGPENADSEATSTTSPRTEVPAAKGETP